MDAEIIPIFVVCSNSKALCSMVMVSCSCIDTITYRYRIAHFDQGHGRRSLDDRAEPEY